MEKPFTAYEGDEPYVFVCYAHADAGTVYPEIAWLCEQGVNIWYDEGISPGAEFPERLGTAILGASAILFYVSPRSVNSRHCRDEIYFSLDHDIPVIALHLEKTELPPGLALSTGTTQALMRHDMSRQNYRRKLLSGLNQVYGETDVADTPQGTSETAPTAFRRTRFVAVSLVLLSLVVLFSGGLAITRYLDSRAELHRFREQLIPEIRALMEVNWSDYTEPYKLALEAEKIAPDDPELKEIFEKISLRINVDSEPAGADVYLKDYRRPEAEWTPLGQTPIDGARLPVGIFRWKFEKPGHQTVYAAASTWDISLSKKSLLVPNHIMRRLDPEDQVPNGMVRVAGTETPLGAVSDFFIDRYEVSNAEYQKFVDSGGYRNPEYWQFEFVNDGAPLSREDALARLVDQSGRPGPSTWLGGTFPEGMENHPVSGVSWYEAAAYARYAGRSLPTAAHWGIARGEYSALIRYPQLGGFALFAPFSNFDHQGTVEVGSLPGITSFGAYDMAGNVREWCSNDAVLGKVVRGGSFNDNPYRFAELSQAPPMKRDADYGIRTVVYPDDQQEPRAAFESVPIKPADDLYDHPVVSDEIFEVFLRQFDYDEQDLDVAVEPALNPSDQWTLERVSVNTPYNDERMIINLFLPRNSSPPFQTVIYFPGSAALVNDSSENLGEYYEFTVFLSFLVKTGRAVAFPVYEGTFERRDDRLMAIHMGDQTNTYSQFTIKLVKDFRRTIDYLESRPDIDTERLAFYGMSWGALMGSIIPAIEKRIKTAILMAGGVYEAGLPEVNSLNYIPRITMPLLMLVGRYDSILDHEASAVPLFEQIGTAETDKLMKVYETDHIPPKSEYVAEILNWLDHYLGPVAISQ